MKHLYCLLLCSLYHLFGNALQAQDSVFLSPNLVSNPGFEVRRDVNFCPSNFYKASDPYPASGWWTVMSPDYYHTCATGPELNPNQLAQPVRAGGAAYAGFIAHREGSNAYSEFLVQTLSSPLQANKHYYVEYWVSLKDNSNYSVRTLGIYLSPVGTEVPGSIELHQKTSAIHGMNPYGTFYANKTGWTKVSAYVSPSQNIDKIVIGNFDPHAAVPHSVNRRFEPDGCNLVYSPDLCNQVAYYYVDDVNIREVCSPYIVLPMTYQISGPQTISTNSYGNFYSVLPVPEASKYEWKIYPHPDKFGLDGQGTTFISLTSWAPTGNYSMTLEVTTPCGIRYAWPGEYSIYVQNPWDGGGGGGGGYEPWLVSPNPAKDRIMIEHRDSKRSGEMKVLLIDSKGKSHKSGSTIQGKLILDTGDLPRGVYYLQLNDGQKTVRKQVVIEGN